VSADRAKRGARGVRGGAAARMLNDVRNREALKATFLFALDAPKPFQLFRILQA
jgi:hypothetical protein